MKHNLTGNSFTINFTGGTSVLVTMDSAQEADSLPVSLASEPSDQSTALYYFIPERNLVVNRSQITHIAFWS